LPAREDTFMRIARSDTRAFTLIELLIVISVIAILSGMAIPNLRSSHIAANEVGAVQAMRMIGKGMEGYKICNRGGDYGYPSDYTLLGGFLPADIDPLLAAGERSGFRFEGGGDQATYTITAVPVTYGASGVRSFYVDESGVIRCADKSGAPATAADPPLN